jgi:hypothetical protein
LFEKLIKKFIAHSSKLHTQTATFFFNNRVKKVGEDAKAKIISQHDAHSLSTFRSYDLGFPGNKAAKFNRLEQGENNGYFSGSLEWVPDKSQSSSGIDLQFSVPQQPDFRGACATGVYRLHEGGLAQQTAEHPALDHRVHFRDGYPN